MKIIFWNIGYVPGLDGSMLGYLKSGHRIFKTPTSIQKKLLDGIAEKIKFEDPDIFLYAEVSTGATRNEYLHQHDYLVEAMGNVKCHGVEGKYLRTSINKLPLHGGNSNGFLSKQDCKGQTAHFTKGSKSLIYVVEVQGVTIIMVHLSLQARTRAHQLEEAAELVSTVKGPVVMCGDMNIFSGVKELDILIKKTGLELPKDLPLTYPAHKPKKSLDIFLTRGIKEKISVRTINTTISDHLPIVLRF